MEDVQKTKKQKKHLRDKLFRTKGPSSSVDSFSWRKRRAETALEREEKLITQLNHLAEEKKAKEKEINPAESQSPSYSVSFAIPGAFLNNAQSAELRTYMAGQIARAATLFCVEEVIVYDETCKMTKESVDAYWAGSWYGDIIPSDANFESCLYLAKILEYLECPQYLRKQLFSFQRPLKYAGLLNPLDADHHLKSDDLSIPFREGVVLDKPVKTGRGPLCDIGLEKELQVEDDVQLPPGTRVTVEITNMGEGGKRYRGKLTSAKKVREATGMYWGYQVKLATSLMEVLDRKRFDLIVGTSPRGSSVADVHVCALNKTRILVVFGGVQGVDAAFEGEEALQFSKAEEAFDHLINTLPNKGSRSERVEENVLITLSELTLRLEQLSK